MFSSVSLHIFMRLQFMVNFSAVIRVELNFKISENSQLNIDIYSAGLLKSIINLSFRYHISLKCIKKCISQFTIPCCFFGSLNARRYKSLYYRGARFVTQCKKHMTQYAIFGDSYKNLKFVQLIYTRIILTE